MFMSEADARFPNRPLKMAGPKRVEDPNGEQRLQPMVMTQMVRSLEDSSEAELYRWEPT